MYILNPPKNSRKNFSQRANSLLFCCVCLATVQRPMNLVIRDKDDETIQEMRITLSLRGGDRAAKLQTKTEILLVEIIKMQDGGKVLSCTPKLYQSENIVEISVDID